MTEVEKRMSAWQRCKISDYAVFSLKKKGNEPKICPPKFTLNIFE